MSASNDAHKHVLSIPLKLIHEHLDFNNYICTSVALNRYLKDASKNLEHYTSTHMHLLYQVIHFPIIDDYSMIPHSLPSTRRTKLNTPLTHRKTRAATMHLPPQTSTRPALQNSSALIQMTMRMPVSGFECECSNC